MTMKIKDSIDLNVLTNYGFTPINKEEAAGNDDYIGSSFDWVHEIGHSRRGQFYYLYVSAESRYFYIYASEPDGSGGTTKMTDVLMRLALDGIIEQY